MTSTGRVATTTLNHSCQTWPQFMPEQHHHGQDGTQLDDYPEHGQELFAGVELDDLLHKDHMARGRDGQPLGNALHDAH